MAIFGSPLGYTGQPPGVTGTPTTQTANVRAATAAEAAAGVLENVYISPATAQSATALDFASPPVAGFGSTTPRPVAATTLSFTSLNPTVGTAGASPRVVNGRVGVAIFSGVSIAAAATQTLVITNSAITGSSTQLLLSLVGATTGAALNIQSYTCSAGSVSIVVENGTGATTSVANITISFIVLN